MSTSRVGAFSDGVLAAAYYTLPGRLPEGDEIT